MVWNDAIAVINLEYVSTRAYTPDDGYVSSLGSDLGSVSLKARGINTPE